VSSEKQMFSKKRGQTWQKIGQGNSFAFLMLVQRNNENQTRT